MNRRKRNGQDPAFDRKKLKLGSIWITPEGKLVRLTGWTAIEIKNWTEI